MDTVYQFSCPLTDAKFKDESPLKTVANIKSILRRYGIETQEIWHETQVPYCHAITVKVVGTNFSVNGKGLTREFTLASGYGELMERLQLGRLSSQEVQKDTDSVLSSGKAVPCSAKELLLNAPDRYARLSARFQESTGKTITPEEILSQYADKNGDVEAMPFRNLTKNAPDYYPAALCRAAYSTNGCAAGNTMEEALVQAMSELVERQHHLRIICENITLPDFPEEMLQAYPAAMAIIGFVRDAGYRVTVKDCSLGTGFPVVCVCFIHEKTGCYHTHFGANPVFEIALQRALTESFQGRSLDTFASFRNFAFPPAQGLSLSAIANEMTKGTWEKRPGFFVGEPAYPCDLRVGLEGSSNRELLDSCLAFFEKQGYEVLMRDCSVMGFPTCQVLIPGYSEIFVHRISQKENELLYSPCAMRTLRNPAAATLEDKLGFLMHIGQMSRFTGNISKIHGFLAGAQLSANIPPVMDSRLLAASMAHIYWSLGRMSAVSKQMESLAADATGDEAAWLICLKRYIDLQANGWSREKIQSLLKLFHGDIAGELLESVDRGENPFDPFVLRCDKTCPDSCLLKKYCCQKHVETLAARIFGE